MGGGVHLGGGEREPTRAETFGMPTMEESYMVAAPAEADPIDVTAAHRSFMAGYEGQDISFTGIMDPELADIVAATMEMDVIGLTSPHGVPAPADQNLTNQYASDAFEFGGHPNRQPDGITFATAWKMSKQK